MTIPTESQPLPKIHGRTNPFKRLAAAVISQAVRDATRQMDRRSATTWLPENDDGFPFWCNARNGSGQIRQELSDLLDPNETIRLSVSAARTTTGSRNDVKDL
jgi:hypothetical protein